LTGPAGKLFVVATFEFIDFESGPGFPGGKKEWNDVHNWTSETDLPAGTTDALKDLYFAFLTDSEDDL
jgi:hypothetical protein